MPSAKRDVFANHAWCVRIRKCSSFSMEKVGAVARLGTRFALLNRLMSVLLNERLTFEPIRTT